MTEAQELIQKARDIRAKLTRPPNAVYDPGIDLVRYRREMRQAAEAEALAKARAKSPKAVVVVSESVRPAKITVEMVMKATCLYFNIGVADLKSPSRLKSLVYPRHIAIHLAYKHCYSPLISGMTMAKIFRRDHTTLLHARDKMKKVVDNFHPLSQEIGDVAGVENLILSGNIP